MNNYFFKLLKKLSRSYCSFLINFKIAMTKVFYLTLLFTFLLFITCNRQNNIRNILPKTNETFIDANLLNGEVDAYCFVNLNGVVYDLGPLYDSTADYTIKRQNENFYFNFCKYGLTKCKKDFTYVVSTTKAALVNNTSNDCTLLSGTNYEYMPRWTINSKIFK